MRTTILALMTLLLFVGCGEDNSSEEKKETVQEQPNRNQPTVPAGVSQESRPPTIPNI
jgi:uncharacterized protein YcfL